MRERQRAERPADDLKLGRGGLVDVEYLCEGLALRHGDGVSRLLEPNTALLIEALRFEGLLESWEVDELRTAYQLLRSVGSRLRLLDGKPSSSLPSAEAGWRDLALRLGYRDTALRAEETFRSELVFTRQRIEEVVGEVVARDLELT